MHPTLIKLGELTVQSYGALIQLALAAAFVLVIAGARSLGNKPDGALRALTAGLVAAYLGGRLGFVAVNWGTYRAAPALELLVGAGFLGSSAIVLGALCVLIFALASRGHVGAAFDSVTPGLVGYWAIANAGCFLAGCCTGAPSSLPWAVRFPSPVAPGLKGVPVHPVQLYSMAIELLLLGSLFLWRPRFRGEWCLRAVATLLAMRAAWRFTGAAELSLITSLSSVGLAAVAAVLAVVLARRQPPPAVSQA